MTRVHSGISGQLRHKDQHPKTLCIVASAETREWERIVLRADAHPTAKMVIEASSSLFHRRESQKQREKGELSSVTAYRSQQAPVLHLQ